jgi:queuine tRNA-ribosyltransferase
MVLGFDGFGFGGWPIDDEGSLVDMVPQVAALTPRNLPLHALGVGMPESIHRARRAGYSLFDCVLPSRDARRKRLYVTISSSAPAGKFGRGEYYEHVYLQDRKHSRDPAPIDATCDCRLCADYSRGYLHHLFQIDDHLAYRLATIHNLRFYSRVMERLRSEPAADHDG